MNFALGPVGAGDVLKAARTEIGEHEFAAGFDHPQHLLQHRLKLTDMVHGIHGHHGAEAVIRPRQAGGVLKYKLDSVFHVEIAGIEPGALLFLGGYVHRRDVARRVWPV